MSEDMTVPLLVQALQRKPVTHPPVWLMRQAGRYLPEYREVRAHFPDFIRFCLTPDAATQVTLQPVERFGLDAAIIFADILTIPHALGHAVTFTKGMGPRVRPVSTPADVVELTSRLKDILEVLEPVAHTVANTRDALPPQKAVIGFCGAPFTVATYMLDDKPSEGIPHTLAFARTYPDAFAALMETLTAASVLYLSMQISAGADVVQVFDSWAAACPPELWGVGVEIPLLTLARALKEEHPETPVILFPRGVEPAKLAAFASKGEGAVDGLSLSTEVDLAWAAETLQPRLAVQGNLDPLLFTEETPDALLAHLHESLRLCGGKPGYIVNVGHGLTPQTNPDYVRLVVETIKSTATG